MPKSSAASRSRLGPRPEPPYYKDPQKFPSAHIDYRQNPHLYRISRAEVGVLTCEPYKSEICAHWRFRTPEIARESARKIEEMFEEYLDAMDDAKVIKKDSEHERGNRNWQRAFVGADMCRKFIQMGMTRAKRYANHASGKKYAADGTIIPIVKLDEEKLAASEIFKEVWNRVRLDPRYVEAKEEWGRLVKVWDGEAKKNMGKIKQEEAAGEDDSPKTSTRRTRDASVAIKKEIKEEDKEDV